ncbi:hypothetical protein A2V68_01855 [candidate division Kazan bacterium RBG_13_50_9]|uniref:Uncharacterized protein n=1 Tax=candidate division Kazan bacterium RBG_13_50_9 TaxID=1798535 RepID=A0A1F4NT04_UNCK3|nr:MAG: hypothetical protein A2V68_01855 [candidate division Kazan bacterium RBG_13_50_9]
MKLGISKVGSIGVWAILLVVVLSAASCRSSITSVGRVAVATQVGSDNAPVGKPQLIILSTVPAIYLSAEVVSAKPGTKVDVEWRYVTGGQTIATESFRGGRSAESPHEFVTGLQPTTSFLSSRIDRDNLSWPLGSYEATLRLDGEEVQRVGFNVVADKDFEEFSRKAMVKNLYLGSQVNNQNQITIPTTTFQRNQGKIYAVALFQSVPAGTTVRAVWKHLDSGKLINDFSASFSGSGYLPFDISLSRFSRLWPDGLWPAGTYEVSLYVDNTQVTTRNFFIS